MSKSYLEQSRFNIEEATSTGGVTGSKRVEDNDKKNYQLKPSIKDAATSRSAKAGGTDQENFGEVIAAEVARALTGSANKEGVDELAPKVSLVYDQNRNRIGVASRYLTSDVKEVGTLDDFARNRDSEFVKAKGELKSQRDKDLKVKDADEKKINAKYEKDVSKLAHRHAVVDGSIDKGDKNKLGIAGKDDELIRKDLAKAIGVSILAGDHDVNPGNMMAVKNEGKTRIARIDFGHAFNDLINTSKVFGGGAKNKENRVLDFLNRETIGHLNKSERTPKLWRDYAGIVPSQELADAFKELGSSKETQIGLATAKAQFADLMKDLRAETPPNKKALNHIKKSLIAINNSVSDNPIKDNLFNKIKPEDVLKQTFENLDKFYAKGQKDMLAVGNVMDLQCKIDKIINDTPWEKRQDEFNKLKTQHAELIDESQIEKDIKIIEWVKTDKDTPAFKGTIDEYIKKRESEIHKSKETLKDKEKPQNKTLTIDKAISKIKSTFAINRKSAEIQNNDSTTKPRSDAVSKAPPAHQWKKGEIKREIKR